MNNKTKKYISYILLAISIFCISIIIISSAYSILTADDFSHGYLIGARNTDFFTYLKASFAYMIEVYLTWQGTYFSMFLQALLSPANNGGLTQLDIEIVISNTLLFLSLGFLIYKGLKFEKNDFLIKSILYFLLVIQTTCFITYYYEIYYWFSGATSYTMPLSVCLIGLTLNLLFIRDNKTKYLVLSCVCGICSGGGSLTVAAFGCYSTLTIFIYDYLNKKKIKKECIFIFVIWVISAVINVLGPGNYIRAGVNSGKTISLVKGFTGCILQVLIRCKGIFLDSPIVLVLLIAALTGLYFGDKGNFKNKMISSIVFVLVSYVVSFPVALATGGPNTSSRLCFLTDFPIYLSSIFLAYNIGIFIKDKVKGKYIRYVTLIVFVISAILIKPNNILITTNNLINGSYSEYHKKYELIFNQFDKQEGQDVVIKKEDYPKDLECFVNFDIESDPSYWVNVGIAEFYNLSSIRVEE